MSSDQPTEAGERRGSVLWKTAQFLGVAITLGAIAGMFVEPESTLKVLWGLVIPLVPASLLVAPALWRNVCPLATLNLFPNGWAGRRKLGATLATRAGLLGIVLLALMVPARHFLFNTDGTALGITVIAVAALAFVLGMFFDIKGGFCNSICPVLPVERLYGQHPLVALGNPRCQPCTNCTTLGCIDLAGRKSITQTLGVARKSAAWLFTPFGAFAAAFPGFVLGYYQEVDGPLDTAGAVYLGIAGWTAASYVLVFAVVWLTNLGATTVMPLLAAAAAGIYYWYAAPILAATLELPGAADNVLRGAFLLLVAGWLASALRRRDTAAEA
ncbi:MAG: hypothetical protein ACYTG6_06935 [Planctomycetota bacterium]